VLQSAFTLAQWAEYVTGALALVTLLLIVWRLSRRSHKVFVPIIALVMTGALCVASFLFLGTRVEQIRLGSITQLGLETHHAGLRTNAIIYSAPVSVTASWKALPSIIPGSGFVNRVSGLLVHKTTTVDAEVAVYGLIDFTTLAPEVATVNRQKRTISLSLPDPTVSKNTTYIWSVDGIQEQTGLLNSVEQSLAGPIESLFHHPSLSFNARPALISAEAGALRKAQHSVALSACGEQEIARQLTAIFNLTPAYSGYTVNVTWPTPPTSTVNCAALQRQLPSADD
jgi:hypothetical protein